MVRIETYVSVSVTTAFRSQNIWKTPLSFFSYVKDLKKTQMKLINVMMTINNNQCHYGYIWTTSPKVHGYWTHSRYNSEKGEKGFDIFTSPGTSLHMIHCMSVFSWAVNAESKADVEGARALHSFHCISTPIGLHSSLSVYLQAWQK